MANSTLVPGEYVLQDLFNEFTVQVNRKIDALLLDTHVHVRINFGINIILILKLSHVLTNIYYICFLRFYFFKR